MRARPKRGTVQIRSVWAAASAAVMVARGEAANEDAFVFTVALHAQAVAQQRAAGDRAGRINRDDGDGLVLAAQIVDEAVDQ